MSTTVVTIHKTTATEHFTILANDLLRGRLPVPLHVMGRCILNHLLSFPPGFKTTREDLNKGFVEGEAAVTSGLRELRTAGYLVQERHRGPGGTWEWSWHVTDDPIARPLTAPQQPSPPAPSTGPPSPVNQGTVTTKPQVAPSPDSPGMVAPEVVDRDTVEGGIKEEDGSRRLGKDAPTPSPQPEPPPEPPEPGGGESGELALVARAEVASKPPTVNQRAKALADAFWDKQPLCKYMAVQQLAQRAISSKRYSDQAIHAALLRLADAGRTATADSLRIELDRPGSGAAGSSGRPSPSSRAARTLAKMDREGA